MPVFPQQPQQLRQQRPLPPPESLRRVTASMQAPQPFGITDARTGLPYDPNAAPPPPQQPPPPPQPQGFGGPLIPPRLSPEEHRLREWARIFHEQGREAATAYGRKDEPRGGALKRRVAKKFKRYKIEKEMRDLDKRFNDATKRVSDLMRQINEASGVSLESARGVTGASEFMMPRPMVRSAANRPLTGRYGHPRGGFRPPIPAAPLSGQSLPNMGPPPPLGLDQPRGGYRR